ncbi:MAG: PAS domain-containing protein [Candidatus Aminicenantes bacterium]|nr:MAG: PAS domain-containing protein [Candidatus Aminicenantes bacterium]
MKRAFLQSRGLFPFVFILIFQACVFAQSQSTTAANKFLQGSGVFDKILYNHELSEASINAIIQGPKGFIWLGTDNGLYRFDGYKCVAHKHDPGDTKSISDNRITCLYLDSQEVLWIGTSNGLNRFHWDTESFTRYQKNEDDPLSLSDNDVSSIYEDSSGYFWIGTYSGGLNRFDRETGNFKSYKHDSANPNRLSSDTVNSLCQDYQGLLWIGTDNGLNRFDIEKETFTYYKHDADRQGTLKENNIWSIFEDSKGVLWVGTWGGGLHEYIRETDQFTYYLIGAAAPDRTETSHNRISCIYEDRTGIIWIGTFGNGLCKFSREEGTFDCYTHDASSPRSISGNMISSIYEDKTGMLWIGTYSGGLNTYDRKKEKISHFIHHVRNPNSLSDSVVQAIHIEDEIIWIGTYRGLNRFNRRNKTVTHFLQNPQDPASISSDVIRYIFIDSYNVLWVSTDNGLNQLNRETEKFTSFQHDGKNPGSISDNKVGPIYEDKKRQLWIGTSKGLNLFDRKEKSFVNFTNKTDDLKLLNNVYILCIHEQIVNGYSILWIGTYNDGLIRFNTEKRELYIYKYDPHNPGGLSSSTIRSIYRDEDGKLWLGTDSGLNQFDPGTGKFLVYAEKQGLPGNKVYGILEDGKGFLWISTQNGLFRFNRQTRESKNIDEGYGVQIRVFNHDAYHKSPSNEMFFGGMNGFISFFPGKIKDNTHIPDIFITDFKIFNKSVGAGSGGRLKKSITETDGIRLSYEENMFSIEFAALDYTWPENNRYKYKMEGFDKDWIETDARKPFASYTNLNHGKYIFKVKGSNNAGIWNEKGTSLKIIITPPFWKEWWFRITVGLSIILLLIILYLNRTRRLRRELAEQQRVQEILKQSRDVMERSRDLAEFRRAEIEKLITAISSLLIAVDANGKIYQWNETAEKCFGIPATQTNGQLFVEVLKDYITPGTLNMLMDKGLGPDNVYDIFEIPIQFKDTGAKLLLGTINPIMDRSGQKLGFLFLAEDITHKKEEEMRRNLSQKLESLGKMARNIAHEIKSPLQYIGNNSYFIYDSFENLVKFFNALNQSLTAIEKSDPTRVKENLEKACKEYDIEYILKEGPKASDQIIKGVSRVTTIIQSMMDYTHPGRGVMEQANIHELLETTLVFIRKNKNEIYQVQTEFCPDIPQVLCYPGELVQVFMNLLINAADAIQEKGKPGLIKITTALNNDEVIVSIADNGCGIPDDIKDNIYNPFFTTKEVGKGTGQGLSLVHNIVTEKHKGKIYYESKPGEGTTFYVHLPLSPDDIS